MLFKKRPRWISEDAWRTISWRRDKGKQLRRQVARFARNPKLGLAYSAYRRSIPTRDWALVRERVKTVTTLAEACGHRHTLKEMISVLSQLGCYEDSQRLWIDQLNRKPKAIPNEWRGEDLQGKNVLIQLQPSDRQGLAVGYRRARLMRRVTRQASRVMAVLEPRLVETFHRSFPTLKVQAATEAIDEGAFDYVISPDRMLAHFLPTAPPLDEAGDFLVADQTLVEQLRQKYRADSRSRGHQRLIGICWYSSHFAKETPEVSDWADFIRRTQAGFVSLQYGNVNSHLKILGRENIIADESIDQLVNMDDFAAQVAALDGVITIVNTLAHVAGALDVPTIVVRDDILRREWPVTCDRTPWYPSVRIAGKDGRGWAEVLGEAGNKLCEIIADRNQ
jgi:hypothetical protein